MYQLQIVDMVGPFNGESKKKELWYLSIVLADKQIAAFCRHCKRKALS